ncbi:TMEM175 family protein [Agromyces aerolatus]|uniref:TMEM175 family protein n=1 Tax=Agromyces sp. LY-1074 TaxID=3074080 RepID=UPI002855E569|nr:MULTISPECIES: TMEM175 family protein [unclassified Agromyces]MDR5699773.1 TMEM175 family protein [Agromyces sp. LY-1074]MDR5706069.1 TMEM175 family protein [Agromyces sp. LY-1358]
MDETKPAPSHYHRDSVEFARAFTFFDAVYAFALTLLVVNIDPPEASEWGDLWTWLSGGLGWQLFGFLVSFVVIAVFWRTNHRLSSGFVAMSSGTMTANIVALVFVVFIPFSTQGISDPETGDQPLAVAVYAVNIAAAVMAQSAIFLVARRDGVIANPLPRRADTVRLLDTATTPLVFLLSIVVAYAWGADWGRWTWALLLVIGPLSGRWADRVIARIVAEDRGNAASSS